MAPLELGIALEREGRHTAREMLIIPSVLPSKYHKPWSQVIENAYGGLPELNIPVQKKAPLRKVAEPANLQTVEQFAAEHDRILQVTQTIRWVKLSEENPDRVHEVANPIIETPTEVPETPPSWVPVECGDCCFTS